MTYSDLNLCSYCGDDGNTMDHVPPISSYGNHVGRKRRRKGNGSKFGNLPWVWACRECNILLGNTMLLTISERAAFITVKLRARYAKLLAAPDWAPEELAELEPTLRHSIAANLVEKARVQHRIATSALMANPPEDPDGA